MDAVSQWNIDGAAIGTSFKATAVTFKPGSEDVQGTFKNTVALEIFEAGRGSTLKTSVDVVMQQIVGKCSPPTRPQPDTLETRVSPQQTAPECPIPAVGAALVDAIDAWNIDGAAIGTSFKATAVTFKPDSEGIQRTFANTVSLAIFEAGRGSTLQASVDVAMQDFGDHCTASVTP